MRAHATYLYSACQTGWLLATSLNCFASSASWPEDRSRMEGSNSTTWANKQETHCQPLQQSSLVAAAQIPNWNIQAVLTAHTSHPCYSSHCGLKQNLLTGYRFWADIQKLIVPQCAVLTCSSASASSLYRVLSAVSTARTAPGLRTSSSGS